MIHHGNGSRETGSGSPTSSLTRTFSRVKGGGGDCGNIFSLLHQEAERDCCINAFGV